MITTEILARLARVLADERAAREAADARADGYRRDLEASQIRCGELREELDAYREENDRFAAEMKRQTAEIERLERAKRRKR